MNWQTILSLVIMAASSGLGVMLTQYPADKVPHWIPIVLAVLATVGGAMRSIGVTDAGAPKVPK